MTDEEFRLARNKWHRTYYAKHPEYREWQRQYQKKWRAAHPEYDKLVYQRRLKRSIGG